MIVGVYGGSIRPGGGLTVLKQIVEAVASDSSNEVIVYTGEDDCSEGMREVIAGKSNVNEVRFFPSVHPGVRYALSKVYFMSETKRREVDALISINYYIPAKCETIVYHLNLLSFMRGEKDSVGMMVKRFDARTACEFANKNIFESNHLLERAGKSIKVNNGSVVYVSVDSDFGCNDKQNSVLSEELEADSETVIAVVSSPLPHKDNITCIKALSLIIERRPEVNWKMIFVGGLSEEGWAGLRVEAKNMGVDSYVEFSGPLSKKDLSKLLNRSLCLMNASLIESFCMVAVEAMKSCCPVMVTDATSMPESVGDAGVVVAQRDACAFADAVELFNDNEEVRREYIEKGLMWASNFSQELFRENFLAVLND